MITAEFEREKETKNTIRYVETADPPKVGMIYMPRKTLEQLGDPERLTITIDAGESLRAAA